MSFGPQLCHRGGVSPLFVVTHSPSPATVSVAAIGAPVLLYAAATGTPHWSRVLSVFIPLTGLLLGHTEPDRVYLLPAITLILAWIHAKQEHPIITFATPLLASISAGLVAGAHRSCNATSVLVLDALAFAIASVQIVRVRPHPPASVILSLFEAAAVAFVIGADPLELSAKASHLTWWGLASLAVFDYANAWGRADSVYAVVLCLQLCVVVGVWFMSLSSCDLLEDARVEVGDLVYGVGNFAMHYWPSLRVLLYKRKAMIDWGRQATVSIGLISVYLALVVPKRVYGCDGWVTNPLILSVFAFIHLVCATYGLVVLRPLW